jgi:hypothetical protein
MLGALLTRLAAELLAVNSGGTYRGERPGRPRESALYLMKLPRMLTET